MIGIVEGKSKIMNAAPAQVDPFQFVLTQAHRSQYLVRSRQVRIYRTFQHRDCLRLKQPILTFHLSSSFEQ
jgi:hypothetical protein